MSAFSERVMNLTRTSLMVGFATSLSWEVGIFQALAESSTPLTSIQVAQAKRLKERFGILGHFLCDGDFDTNKISRSRGALCMSSCSFYPVWYSCFERESGKKIHVCYIVLLVESRWESYINLWLVVKKKGVVGFWQLI